jgi:hypothetical protein
MSITIPPLVQSIVGLMCKQAFPSSAAWSALAGGRQRRTTAKLTERSEASVRAGPVVTGDPAPTHARGAEVADGAQARREDAPDGPRRRGRLVSFSPGQARSDGRAYVPPEIPPLRLRRQLAPRGAEPSRWLARSRCIPVSYSRGGLSGGRGAVGGRSVSSSEALRFGRRDPRLTHAERGAEG